MRPRDSGPRPEYSESGSAGRIAPGPRRPVRDRVGRPCGGVVFLEHFESAWMVLPLVAIGLGLATLGLRIVVGPPLTIHLFRGVMCVTILIGLLGAVLHYQAGAEFQSDMDPTLSAGQLLWKVLHMKAPPMLAPGVLAQFGLLGLITTYGLPAGRTVPASTIGVRS